MQKILFTLLVVVLSLNLAFAQNSNGQLSDEALQKIQSSFKGNTADVALMNAITHNSIKKLI